MVTQEEAYAMWRFTMWMKGYGSYNDIEQLVGEGDLVPFREYPDRSDEFPVEVPVGPLLEGAADELEVGLGL